MPLNGTKSGLLMQLEFALGTPLTFFCHISKGTLCLRIRGVLSQFRFQNGS
ncbi:hypothetical protein FHK02_5717 [Spirosoma sp. LMG 31448]|uniref:Uncharacterized protein n=1 Tax=Spirosoma utsteinense TaxID=2585773 RepID=A0ABR6WFV5_9BACT|nr:hypothetical protein [Spirosoma utsteinense]MBC3795058.1 hypothetical protein [Spirosoma utsteinense]